MAIAKPSKAAPPARRPHRGINNSNQYFDVGKVGRKTGITLQDTGIRDEHGLEPVSGIFSSPSSAPRDVHGIFGSDGMDVQESSAPDVTETLTSRRKPRLPPARQSTPRHTNIGSPKRMSSARPASRAELMNGFDPDSPTRSSTQPPTNRLLNFAGSTNQDRKSKYVEDNQSPFKPTKVLRRSTGPVRRDPFVLEPSPAPEEPFIPPVEYDEQEDAVQTTELFDEDDDAPSQAENVNERTEQQPDPNTTVFYDDIDQENGKALYDHKARMSVATPASSRSGDSREDAATLPSRSKRTHDSFVGIESEGEEDAPQDEAEDTGSAQKRLRQSPVVIDDDDQVDGEDFVDPALFAQDDDASGNDESAAESQLQEDLSEPAVQPDLSEPIPSRQKKEKAVRISKKGKERAEESHGDSAIGDSSAGSPLRANASPSRRRQRGASAGPTSNVHLRATTPFEDAGQNTSRFGRNLIQPLKFWENESRIWRNGNVEGIIRAEPADATKTKRPKRGRRKQTTRNRSATIAEESETESVMPDEWEETVGVLSGLVSQYDPQRNDGDPDQPIQEDLAFAASSIVTRDVLGSDFKYAKIMTIPFFGAGVVELPPEGYKRVKNSKKMQMVFFVHEGKVTVEVGGNGLEVNQFALSKGGAWIVPRGNKYTITNPSKTKDAKVFFAQGCVVDSPS